MMWTQAKYISIARTVFLDLPVDCRNICLKWCCADVEHKIPDLAEEITLHQLLLAVISPRHVGDECSISCQEASLRHWIDLCFEATYLVDIPFCTIAAVNVNIRRDHSKSHKVCTGFDCWWVEGLRCHKLGMFKNVWNEAIFLGLVDAQTYITNELSEEILDQRRTNDVCASREVHNCLESRGTATSLSASVAVLNGSIYSLGVVCLAISCCTIVHDITPDLRSG